ncbi:30S ribosomal protein S13 [Candidatus Bathyarchaeota archaeon]|nr:30S ribosomal protein S13 [Candidatus Bathyarchaeota archaeon]
MSESNFREIVRVLQHNLDGNRLLVHGLSGVPGIGRRFAQLIVNALSEELDPRMRTGFLTDEHITKIEEVVKNPLDHGFPAWMLNRRKDFRTGKDLHIVSSELAFRKKLDIDRMRRIRSWKGIRHALGLKVRGQRTRTTGRSGLVVGVHRKLLKKAAKE